jgi:hypothetical protein
MNPFALSLSKCCIPIILSLSKDRLSANGLVPRG